MPNMRVISTNLADIAGISITAGGTAGNTQVSYMQNDYKSQFHRSTATTVTYTLTWTTDQTMNGVVLPCTNLTKSATIRVVLRNSAGTTVADSQSRSACTDSPISQLTTSTPTGNLFQLGVVSKTAIWFSSTYTTIRSATITLTDGTNPAAFIDCARIICGLYWEPTYNASRDGLNLTIADTSQNSRTDAGDLISDRGFIYDELSLNLGLLTDTDRDNLLRIFRNAGTNKNILVSVFPTNYNVLGHNNITEQHYTVYGKRNSNSFNYTIQGYGSSALQITGW